MRESVTMRLDPKILKKARQKAVRDNRSLPNYIETLMRRDLGISEEPFQIEVIAPPDIRQYEPIREDWETDEEFEAHKRLMNAILTAGGY